MEPVSHWDLPADGLPCSLAVQEQGQVWLVDAEHQLYLLTAKDHIEPVKIDRRALAGDLLAAAPRRTGELWLVIRGNADGRNRLAVWQRGQPRVDPVELPAEPTDIAAVEHADLLLYIAADRSLHWLEQGKSRAVQGIRCIAAAANSSHLACVRRPQDDIAVAEIQDPRWRSLQPAGSRKIVGLTPASELALLELQPWCKGEGPPPSTILLKSLSGQEQTILTAPVAMAAMGHGFLAAALLSSPGRFSVELYKMDQ